MVLWLWTIGPCQALSTCVSEESGEKPKSSPPLTVRISLQRSLCDEDLASTWGRTTWPCNNVTDFIVGSGDATPSTAHEIGANTFGGVWVAASAHA